MMGIESASIAASIATQSLDKTPKAVTTKSNTKKWSHGKNTTKPQHKDVSVPSYPVDTTAGYSKKHSKGKSAKKSQKKEASVPLSPVDTMTGHSKKHSKGKSAKKSQLKEASVPLSPADTTTKYSKKHSKKKNAAKSQKKKVASPATKENPGEDRESNATILVTVDGGSATKKSPISKSLAEKFNLIYLESGALYRTVAYVLLKHNLPPEAKNEQKIEDLLANIDWKVSTRNHQACFIIDGEFLSDKELRSDLLNATVASYSSQFESVHELCLKLAHRVVDYVAIEGCRGLIAEGRTCGTKAFPAADLKFWFIASDKAKIDFRRGEEKEMDDPLQRDIMDRNSPFAPLREPDDAIRVWTHHRSIEENIALTAAFIEQKLDEKNELAKLEER
jgi:cytidylate kinase